MMLQVQNVSCRYGGFTAVDEVSLSLHANEILGIAGTNGAGKSTLFAAIAGQQTASSGKILFEGHDISKLPPHLRAQRGLVRTFQVPREFKSLTVHENLLAAAPNVQGEQLIASLVMTAASRQREQALAEKADHVLRFLNLAQVRDTQASQLSGGQKNCSNSGVCSC